MGLARSLDAEPIFISQLVRVADVASSVAALEQVLNHTTVPSASLDTLSSAFQNMENYDTRGEGFTRATVGEMVSELALLTEDRAALLQYYNADPKMTGYLNGTPDLKGEQDYLETTFPELRSARQKPFPDRVQAVNDLIQTRVAEARSRGFLFTAMNWDSVQHITEREARCLANLRTAMTAIALEKFRALHGTYPASLADLTPVYLAATPLNPIDGKPLLYQKRGEGYTLKSITPAFSVIRPPRD